ncbi:4825_t:CDS:1, partial [Entrophospora sp. SA101]
IVHGTTDVVVFEPKALIEQDVVKLIFELKKASCLTNGDKADFGFI